MTAADDSSRSTQSRWRGVDLAQRDAARRVRLLDAGLQLFGTDGYAATSVAAICASAGVSTRSYYEHFADREALLAAVFDQVAAEVAERLDMAMSGEVDLEAMCWAGAAAVIETYVGDERRARVVCREAIGVSPAVEKRRAVSQVRAQEILVAHIEPFRASGQITGLDLRWTLIGVIGAVQGILGVWLTLERRPSPAQLTAVVARLLHAGLTAPEPRAPPRS